MSCLNRRGRHLPTIKKIPDELWYEIKLILPQEKPNNTIGRPVVQFRKTLNGILYVKNRMPKEDIAKRVCSGSTYHKRFQDLTMVWSISETVDQIIGNI